MGLSKVFFPLIIVLVISMSISFQSSFAESGDYIVLDNTGNLLLVTPSGTISTIVTSLGNVDGLAVDAGGDYIVGDSFGNLLRISSSGEVSIVVSGLGAIDAVAVDGSGNYIVGDNFGNLLLVEPDGTITLIQDTLGSVNAVAVDCGGNYIVGDNFGNLLLVEPDGAVSLIEDGFGSVNAVAVDKSCNYIVGDNFGNLLLIAAGAEVFGNLLPTAAAFDEVIVSGLGIIKGLAIDSGKPVAVIDFSIDDLLKVTSTGFVIPVIGVIFIAIGGTAFPIDSTSLVLAYAQTNLFWWMPIVIAGVLLSIFLVRKKRTSIKTRN